MYVCMYVRTSIAPPYNQAFILIVQRAAVFYVKQPQRETKQAAQYVLYARQILIVSAATHVLCHMANL